jgi:hypothetical protein
MNDKWVTKSKVTDRVFHIDSEYWCEMYANAMNAEYQTDEYIAEPFDPRKGWLK